jgi:hypothetical protein
MVAKRKYAKLKPNLELEFFFFWLKALGSYF